MTPRERKALAGALYGLAVLAFFEASARLALQSEAFFRRVVGRGQDESSWRLRWVVRQVRQGKIYYEFDVHDPLRGWALRPNIRDLPVYEGKRLNSNSRGLRGRREYPYEKTPGTVRVLALGDSFTFGEGVSDDETWCQDLERMLPGVEVLNLGVHGYGQDQMLLYLREEGGQYHPDAVVLGFIADDMERNLLAFRDYAKPRFVLEGGRLVLTHTPVPSPEEMLAREPYRSKLLDLLVILRGRLASAARREGEARRITVAILDAMADAIRGVGAQPAFAYLPVYGEISKRDMAMTERERFFFGYCRERGIQSMYLRRFFIDKMKRGVEFKTYGHWGPLEHQTAAEGIKAYLLEKQVIRLAPPPG